MLHATDPSGATRYGPEIWLNTAEYGFGPLAQMAEAEKRSIDRKKTDKQQMELLKN
jgi:hypothetical protein